MVEEWRSNTIDQKNEPISSSQKAAKVEVLSDEDEKVYSSDSMTFGSPEEEETSLESDDEAFEDKDKEFFISSPRLRHNMEEQKSFESSGDERKKVTFSKHLVKV